MEPKQHQESVVGQCIALQDDVAILSHPQGIADMKSTQDGPKPIEEELSIENMIKDIGDDLRATCLQWLHPMTETEKFEKLSPSQVDDLLEAARALESHLKQEKQKLLKRLQVLSRTLQIT